MLDQMLERLCREGDSAVPGFVTRKRCRADTILQHDPLYINLEILNARAWDDMLHTPALFQ